MAEECAYRSAKEFVTATQSPDGGFDVTYWKDDYFVNADSTEHCGVKQVLGGLWSECSGGWTGPVIVAASAFDAHDTGILVILNDVLYRDPVCTSDAGM